MADENGAKRKVRIGVVVSDKMDKTRVVSVEWSQRHPLYRRRVRRRTSFKAHDEQNLTHEGDLVRIIETRPLSKDKRWRIGEILQKGEVVELKPQEVDQSLLEELEHGPEVAAPSVEVAEAPAEEAVAEAPAEVPVAEVAEEAVAEAPVEKAKPKRATRAKATTAKKTTAKATAAKKTTAKATTAKATAAKKATAKKTTAKKAPAKATAKDTKPAKKRTTKKDEEPKE